MFLFRVHSWPIGMLQVMLKNEIKSFLLQKNIYHSTVSCMHEDEEDDDDEKDGSSKRVRVDEADEPLNCDGRMMDTRSFLIFFLSLMKLTCRKLHTLPRQTCGA